MDQGKDAVIRARAFQLWLESDGSHGHDEEHWRRAEQEYGGSTTFAAGKVRTGETAAQHSRRHEDGVSPFPAQDDSASVT